MFKIAKSKITLLLLAAAVMLGGLFLFIFARRYLAGRYAEGPALEKGAAYREAFPPERMRELAKEGLPREKITRVPEKARLPVRLVGIYEHEKKKTACIENLATSKTGYYAVGDSVVGARVIQILPGAVALIKDGKKIILSMENPYDWAEPDDWIDAISDDSFVVSKARLNRKVWDVNQLLGEVVAFPRIVNNEIVGFYISFLKEGGVIEEAGVRKGDVIKEINERPLDGLKEPIRVYEYLRHLVEVEKEPAIKIELERDEKPHTFTYRILK
jgi:type II secretory pathway component PulC